MKRPEEVFDIMIELGVGARFAKTYSKISEYYENELLDYRRADKVYRVGLEKIESESSDRELRNLESLYERFCDRMVKRVEKDAVEEINRVRKSKQFQIRNR